jgi:hypothetical protein
VEIDITDFVKTQNAYDFSGSVAERGKNAGKETWSNAQKQAASAPLLTTPEQIQALRDHVKGFGAWEDDEIAAWSDAECNALFIQLISGDIREAGLDDGAFEDIDWDAYEAGAQAGRHSGNISHSGDSVFYSLGD